MVLGLGIAKGIFARFEEIRLRGLVIVIEATRAVFTINVTELGRKQLVA